MITRRDFLQTSMATAALYGADGFGNWSRLAAQQQLSQGDLLDFQTFGNVTLIHITDLHAQLKPVYYREAGINIGVGDASGLPPHLTGTDFLKAYGVSPGTPSSYALSSADFSALAKTYGRVGGLDRTATVIKAIRADRPDALLLDGGDTWQGSYTALKTGGQDMVDAMNTLGVEAMTGHWEFTLGIDRVRDIIDSELNFPFLGANIFDTEWDERAFEPYQFFVRGGVNIAVIGQAFPYTPIANPAWMFPELSFGVREENMSKLIAEVRQKGAGLVVLLSHNGFDVDRKLAANVPGIDVILTGHSHDVLPEPVIVGTTLLIASGSHGKFVTRLDLDVDGGQMKGFAHRLIPVFADVIEPDPHMADLIQTSRAPFERELSEILGQTETALYRRGNFNGTWDDLICQSLLQERQADIALSPGFRWGPSLVPGDDITREDLFNVTSMSYPNAYRTEMTGEYLHTVLEDVADNLFNPDPYYQQGGDMVRVGGMQYTIDITKPRGKRISNMTLAKTGASVDPSSTYIVAGWASVAEFTEGPPIWDVVEAYIRTQKSIHVPPNQSVRIMGQ